MKTAPLSLLVAAIAALAFAQPLLAQNWSVGVGSGPFVFGDFMERTVHAGVPGGSPSDPVTLTLSAATRAGLTVDLERSFSERVALRLEGTFTRSELSVRDETSDDGISIDAGDLDVSTFAAPIVFRINPRGAFRFHVHGGPALAIYRIDEPDAATNDRETETHTEWGALFGGGVAWWVSDRFAVEASLSDIITTSPFEQLEDEGTPGVDAKRPHNVHTTVGVRWRF